MTEPRIQQPESSADGVTEQPTVQADGVPPPHGGGAINVTQRKRAEEARDAVHEHMQQVLEAIADGVLVLDRDWRIRYLNRSAREILAASGEVLETRLWESYPGTIYEDSPYVKHYYRAMNEGEAGEFEAYYPEPLNSWYRVIVRPARVGIILFFRDVAERRRQEEALRESAIKARLQAQRLDAALGASDTGTFRWDPTSGNFLEIDNNLKRLYGKTPETWFHSVEDFINPVHPDDAPGLSAAIDSCRSGADFSMEYRVLLENGSIRWLYGRAKMEWENGQPTYLVGACTDITSRKRVEEALRSSEAQFRQIADSLPQLVWVTRPDGYHEWYNQRWYEYTGTTPDQSKGEGWNSFFHPDDRERAWRVWRHSLQTGEPYIIEYRCRRHDGGYRWFLGRALPLRGARGTIVRWFGTCTDIHEQKRAEAALLQSEKLAAVGRLASSIAHEINNPLESVTNLIYLARNHSELPEEIQRYLETADRELRRVSIIASQTLRFHKQATKPQAIGCADLFSTVLSIYEGKLKNSNITVEKRKRANKPVVCFEEEIRQVLNNLVGNAIDAMPNGGRLILRSREATDWKTGRQGLMLTVTDTGTGIDPKAQSQIFQAFFTTKGIAGTGLGLWVSAEIMQRHRGRIRMRSSQNEKYRGTVVAVFLPFDGPNEERSFPSASGLAS